MQSGNNSSDSTFIEVQKRQKITVEKKKMVINLYESGLSIKDSAETVGVNYKTACSILSRYKKNGEQLLENCWGGYRRTCRTQEVLAKIEKIVEENSFITLKQIKAELQKEGINFVLSVKFN